MRLHLVSRISATLRVVLACALAALTAAAIGCSDEDTDQAVPPAAAAVVGQVQIPRAAVDRKVARFQRSVTASGQPVTDAQIARVRSNLSEGLIQSEWLRQELAAQKIDVSGHEGQAQQTQQLARKRTGAPASATKRRIEAYYRRHKHEYVQLESRELRAVLAPTKAKASGAVRARQAGETWAGVVDEFSAPNGPRNNVHPGELNVSRSGLEPALGKAIFRARVGPLQEPVETSEGWLVFEVRSVTPKRQQQLSELRMLISKILSSERETVDVERVNARLRTKYRPKTTCAKPYRSAACGNGS